jgi:hypothetical protein
MLTPKLPVPLPLFPVIRSLHFWKPWNSSVKSEDFLLSSENASSSIFLRTQRTQSVPGKVLDHANTVKENCQWIEWKMEIAGDKRCHTTGTWGKAGWEEAAMMRCYIRHTTVNGKLGVAECVMVCMGFEISIALKIQVVVFWVITLCTLVSVLIIDCFQGKSCEGMTDALTGLGFPLSVILTTAHL